MIAQDLPGYIYFVQAMMFDPNTEDGWYGNLVKIGFTRHPEQRLPRLQFFSPVQLVLLAYKAGDRAEEARLHREFGMARSHGEWFRPDESIVDHILMSCTFINKPLLRRK